MLTGRSVASRGRALAAVALLLTAAVAVVAGCDSDDHGTAQVTPPPVRLGLLAPLSGRIAPSGQAMVRAATLAVREANAAGGVLGRQVELVTGDDACDPGTAVDQATSLLRQGITVSVGGYCSSATVPTMKIFRTAGVPMIIPLANSTDLLAPGYDSVFLLSGTVVDEAAFAAGWIKRLGGRRLALVHDETSFPITLAEETARAVAGGPVEVTTTLALAQGAPGYPRIADAVLDSGADTVYYTGYYGEANQLIIDLRTRGFTGRIIVGDGAIADQLLARLNPGQLREVYGTALLMPAFMPEAADWSARFRAAYGTPPPPATIEAYDAVLLAVDAIRRAGTLDPAKVSAAIGQTRELSLVSGPVAFGADGTRVRPRFLMVRALPAGFEPVPASR